jgi:hypothetical protein
MELSGSSYLFTLSTISITFAGLVGGRLTDFDVYFVRTVLLRGFMVAGCAPLPPLLDGLFELAQPNTWRLSSLITAVVQSIFLATWPARRRAEASVPISKWAAVNQTLLAHSGHCKGSTPCPLFPQ